ncbi:MAG: helix-turn-helix domain-containing protein [Pseudomonadota bacterium]
MLSFLRTTLLGVHAIEFLVRSRRPGTVRGTLAAAGETAVAIHIETTAQILRLYHAEKWRCGTIARHLGVHHSTVKRVLAQAGLPRIASQRAA